MFNIMYSMLTGVESGGVVHICTPASILVNCSVVILYGTEFWREKIMVNLANCKTFTKLFLSNIFLPKSSLRSSYSVYS